MLVRVHSWKQSVFTSSVPLACAVSYSVHISCLSPHDVSLHSHQNPRRQATVRPTPKSGAWNAAWAAVRLRPELGLWVSAPTSPPWTQDGSHPRGRGLWPRARFLLSMSGHGAACAAACSWRPGAAEPAGLPGEEGLPRPTWQAVRGERGANIQNHECSRTHGGTFKCYILNLYKEMKNLGCDSGSQISSMLRQSCDTTGFLGVAPQSGPQAAGGPRPHGEFSIKGRRVGWVQGDKDTFPSLVSG